MLGTCHILWPNTLEMDYNRSSPCRRPRLLSGPLGPPVPTTSTQCYKAQARRPHSGPQARAPTRYASDYKRDPAAPGLLFSEPEAKSGRCPFCNIPQPRGMPLSYTIFSCFRNLKHRPSWPEEAREQNETNQ